MVSNWRKNATAVRMQQAVHMIMCTLFVCNPIYTLLKNSSTIIYISSPFNSGLVQQAMHENCKGQKDHDKKE